MDVFEFTEALRRQKKILIIGAILIVGLVVFLGFDFEDGFGFRAKPRYESTIQIAVVPSDLDSLSDPLPDPGAVAGTAGLYAMMLSTPEATVAIMQETGVQLVERLAVATTGRDGFLGVKATTRDPEGARKAVLQSFTWLKERVTDPLAIVRPEVDAPATPASILDDNGRFAGKINVDSSPTFAETATGIWMSVDTAESQITFSLADAAISPPERLAILEPDSDVVISLEDVFGNPIDAITARVPPLPGPDTAPYVLKLRLDRGALHFPRGVLGNGTAEAEPLENLPDPELVERHILMSWEPIANGLGETREEPLVDSSQVGLLLLTEDPVALETGSRRGPVLVLAALVGGFFALIAIVVMVDTWTRARWEGRSKTEDDHTAAAELLGIDGKSRASEQMRELG
jgi:hypothetical protein